MRSAPIRGSLRGPERPRYKAVSERLRLRGATCSLLVGLVVNRERGEVLFIMSISSPPEKRRRVDSSGAAQGGALWGARRMKSWPVPRRQSEHGAWRVSPRSHSCRQGPAFAKDSPWRGIAGPCSQLSAASRA